MAIDPVCNMTVDENTAEHKTEYEGETYCFCAPGCKTAFEEDPGKYLKGEKAVMEDMPKKKWWQIWK
ncbi:MAG: YHS domain-containing protein [Candidatus Hydrothermarchaeales archaeon]